ncbi:MAG: sulfatase-like hydrolase/transferase, partial [Deltaproteobacteria bacterium]|nr:sulfatase-like hydrolase/transferase [Deltaproteobacteria bacterium]
MLMLMESWSPFYIDSFGNNNFGVTPNFDRLANNGLQFTNFYAVGQRSIEGIQASLTGVPLLIGLPNLGLGLEASNFPKIGNILREKGYETIFMQSSRRRSFRVDAIAR